MKLDKNTATYLCVAMVVIATVCNLDLRRRRYDAKMNPQPVEVVHRVETLDEKTQNLVALHKKMLSSYMQDLHDFQRMNISEKSNIIRFSHLQIAKIRQKLAQLERQQNAG